MKRLYWLVFLVACGSSPAKENETSDPAKVDDAYKADIEALCDVINRSGTAEMDPNERAMKIAAWLGTNLKSQDGRKFLSKIRPIKGAEKGDALDAEAVRVGLPGCALATEWRKPRP